MENNPQLNRWGADGWQSINIAFLIGGLILLARRIYTWHIPLSILITFTFISVIFYDPNQIHYQNSPLFHLLSGGMMLGVFFIATDPVTATSSHLGKVIYGGLIGCLIFIIRTWGNYPDAIAFSVLLMNFTAPLIDHYIKPKTYGR